MKNRRKRPEMRRRLRHERRLEQMILKGSALFSLTVIAVRVCGMRAAMLAGIAALTALLTQAVCLRVRKKAPDLSLPQAMLDGVILLMLMPVSVPVSLLIISCIFAIIISNFRIKNDSAPVVPAAPAGYCLAWLVNRSGVMLFPASAGHLPLFSIDRSLLTEGLSADWNRSWKFPPNPVDWIIGLRGLPLGSCSLFLLLVIAAVFLIRGAASPYVFIPMLLPLIPAYMLFTFMRFPVRAAAAALITNQLLFSALFIYGDSDFAPPGIAGILFGLMTASGFLWMQRHFSSGVLWTAVLLGLIAALLRNVMRNERKKRRRSRRADKENAAPA